MLPLTFRCDSFLSFVCLFCRLISSISFSLYNVSISVGCCFSGGSLLGGRNADMVSGLDSTNGLSLAWNFTFLGIVLGLDDGDGSSPFGKLGAPACWNKHTV